MRQSVVATPWKIFRGRTCARRSGRLDCPLDAGVVAASLRVAHVDVFDVRVREKLHGRRLRLRAFDSLRAYERAPTRVGLQGHGVREEIGGEPAVFRVPLALILMDEDWTGQRQ